MSTITASDVAALRKQTGAGMMDCKKALEEAGGDMEKAVEVLRVKMGNKLGKLADREAGEGTVQAYQPYWAARAHLCKRLARTREARVAFDAAIRLTSDDAVRRFLERAAAGLMP